MLKHTIAVVEDDKDMRENLVRFLQKSGFDAWGAASAEDFYVQLLRNRADLVLLDLGLPGESGLTLARRLAEHNIPVIVQTALGSLPQRIEGFDAGALQYFVKPTDMHELVAGIRAQLRHRGKGASVVQPQWRLDTASAQLIAPNQRTVALTSRELEVLQVLVQAQGTLVTKQAMLDALGLASMEDGFHRIESLLTRLRRKTQDSTERALPVRAVFGRGLVFVA